MSADRQAAAAVDTVGYKEDICTDFTTAITITRPRSTGARYCCLISDIIPFQWLLKLRNFRLL